MDNWKKIFRRCAYLLLVISLASTAVLGWKVHLLNEQIDDLLERIPDRPLEEESDTTFDYLAIGNSITIHGTCDYWWSTCGMAASEVEKDYVHLVVRHLREREEDVRFSAVNLAAWETLATDRAETIAPVEGSLSDGLDLVTIQLGENAKDLKTFATDFKYLLQHIREKAPNAKVIVIGDFWPYENRDEIKQAVARECGVAYADLSEIVKDPAYQCGIGAVVKDPDGGTHVVEHPGVAVHPNDTGMQYIAGRVMDAFTED